MIAFSTTTVIASLVFAGMLQYLWGLINTLQIITLTALFSILAPLNAQYVMFQLMGYANFDIFRTQDILQAMFNFKETEPFNVVFEQAGYESATFIIELGLMFFVISSTAIYQLIKTILKLSTRNCSENWFTRFLRRETNLRLPIVRFLIEGYLELGLVALISLRGATAWQFEGSFWDPVSTMLAFVQLIILALTPFYLGYAARKLLSSLDSEADDL